MERVILFARRPRLGRVKTRLVPPLTPEQALALYEAFLLDQLAWLASLAGPGRRAEVCTDGPWSPRGRWADAVRGLDRAEQGAGDLGERMLRAVTRSRSGGARATVVVGADAPTLPRSRVDEAFSRLARGAHGVVGPAEDGGYVLIGMAEPHAILFRGIAWGGDGVLEATLARARDGAIRLVRLAPWYDVDDARALDRLRRELRDPAARRRAPATAATLGGIDG